jgi:hypothetical protein
MAATHRQKSKDAKERRRGRYAKTAAAAKAKKLPASHASMAPRPTPPPSSITREEWAGWVDQWVESSTMVDKVAARAHAEALAFCRRFVAECLEQVAALPDVLTDGQARTMARCLKEQTTLARALGVDLQKKKKRGEGVGGLWAAAVDGSGGES